MYTYTLIQVWIIPIIHECAAMIGGAKVWVDLLGNSEPVPGRPDLFVYAGKKHRQPTYNKITGICEVLWCVCHSSVHVCDLTYFRCAFVYEYGSRILR